MRTHRKYEKVSNVKLTVQVPVLTPRQLMNLLSDDIEIDLKARSGTYGNGSEDFPVPRSMNIARMSSMIPDKKTTPPDKTTSPDETTSPDKSTPPE